MLKTFYLNKKSSLTQRPISLYEGRECVHTEDKELLLPKQFSFCYRHKPMVFNYRSGIVSFGRINSHWTNMEVGFVHGNWDSGVWIGFLEGLKPIKWYGLGLQSFQTQVWRHSCVTFDFERGGLQIYENGQKMNEEPMEKFEEIYAKLEQGVNIFTVGCAYIENLEEDWTYAMSMLGSFTDFQVFGRILSQDEAEDITGCRSVVQGDLVSWEHDDWYLNGTEKTSEVEYLRFQGDVCKNLSFSLHFVPFASRGLHYGANEVCAKLSGDVAG